MVDLRDYLLDALKTLPGRRVFHVHALTTTQHKHTQLYPFANPRPRVYAQDILVLVSEQEPPLDSHASDENSSSQGKKEAQEGSSKQEAKESHSSAQYPHVFVCAVEAVVYHIPSTSSAILYISKVDSTGQHASQEPSPAPTATIVRALLTFYADAGCTRPRELADVRWMWIQLFARAQNQYLFPNSADWHGKKWLNDIQLCAWWRRTFEVVAKRIRAGINSTTNTTKEEGQKLVKLYYILPGQQREEAEYSLHYAASSSFNADRGNEEKETWIYAHPSSQSDVALPCSPPAELTAPNLGHYIPWFDDDPKSRFLDDLAYTTKSDAVRSPVRKRPRLDSSSRKNNAGTTPSPLGHTQVRQKEEEEESHYSHQHDHASHEKKKKTPVVMGDLGSVSPEEFWERMSFRQECVAGAMTGFFSMLISTPSATLVTATSTTQESSLPPPQPGQVPSTLNKRVISTLMTSHEFDTPEHAHRSTQVLEEAIRHLCEGLETALPAAPSARRRIISTSTEKPTDTPSSAVRSSTPPPSRKQGRTTREDPGPSTLNDVHDEEGEEDTLPPPLAPSSPPQAKQQPSSSPATTMPGEASHPEPKMSLEIYEQYIYGSVFVDNPLPPKPSGGNPDVASSGATAATGSGSGQNTGVTVLTVRKKKKAAS